MPSRGEPEEVKNDEELYAGDQAYQMYQELLNIVRSGDEPEEEASSASTDITDQYRAADNYTANMTVVPEESETEYPSFTAKRGNTKATA